MLKLLLFSLGNNRFSDCRNVIIVRTIRNRVQMSHIIVDGIRTPRFLRKHID